MKTVQTVVCVRDISKVFKNVGESEYITGHVNVLKIAEIFTPKLVPNFNRVRVILIEHVLFRQTIVKGFPRGKLRLDETIKRIEIIVRKREFTHKKISFSFVVGKVLGEIFKLVQPVVAQIVHEGIERRVQKLQTVDKL